MFPAKGRCADELLEMVERLPESAFMSLSKEEEERLEREYVKPFLAKNAELRDKLAALHKEVEEFKAVNDDLAKIRHLLEILL
jgi:hypothetical protein